MVNKVVCVKMFIGSPSQSCGALPAMQNPQCLCHLPPECSPP